MRVLGKADSDLPSKLVVLIGKEPTDHTCTREPREACVFTLKSQRAHSAVCFAQNM